MTRLDDLYEMIADPGDDCVIWPYYTKANGYGQVWAEGRMQHAHRLALISATGPAPTRMEAAHGPCHERACVNPRHLSWKTRKENAADMLRDGTTARGEAHSQSKLTAPEVLAIRAEYEAGGVSQRELSRRFRVNQPTISRTVNRKNWAHLTDIATGSVAA